jgi:hypothetical protein
MTDVDTGNTAFMLLCASLVMLMTPGLAFFYGGLVERKNVLSIMMQSFVSLSPGRQCFGLRLAIRCALARLGAASLATRHITRSCAA